MPYKIISIYSRPVFLPTQKIRECVKDCCRNAANLMRGVEFDTFGLVDEAVKKICKTQLSHLEPPKIVSEYIRNWVSFHPICNDTTKEGPPKCRRKKDLDPEQPRLFQEPPQEH